MRPVPVLGGPLRGARWLSTSSTHGCWLGTYERDLQAMLAATLGPGQTFYDVGANVGFFSLLGARCVGPSGLVAAFEPLPRNVDILHRHLAMNAITNVRVLASAVADSAGQTTFGSSGSPSMGRVGTGSDLVVPVVSLDGLVRSGSLPPPQVIKMDIEGAESLALAGAREILATARPVVFLSTHGYQQHEACCAMLSQLGYNIQLRQDGALDGQYEVVASPS